MMHHIVAELKQKSSSEFDQVLLHMVEDNKLIEYAYIVDQAGIQISEVISLGDNNANKNSKINQLLFNSTVNSDHSLRKILSEIDEYWIKLLYDGTLFIYRNRKIVYYMFRII